MNKLAQLLGRLFAGPEPINPYSEVKTVNVDATVHPENNVTVGEHKGINYAGTMHDIHWNNLKGDFRTTSPNEMLFKY
ncbi:hypothetical protein MA9V1_254 [Chryseobacterium phage MA9V-1]|nr:hypothetical protein MA9V1_254 [Chryseobacterium phage MA9V-1]